MTIKTITMSIEKFIKIPDNPIQRDTVRHSKTAKKYHLSESAVTQSKVSIAKCGKLQWKLDGHTRAYLWDEGELVGPSMLSVDVYTVKDKSEAIELYSHFDNGDAAESNGDKITGALRFMNLNAFDTKFACNTGILSAVQSISMAMRQPIPRGKVLQIVLPWKKEIKVLLEQQWTTNRKGNMPGTPSCVIAAFLVTVRMYKEDSLGFWDGFYTGIGTDLKSGRDGSMVAVDWIHKARADDKIMGRYYVAVNACALIEAYQLYRARKPVNRLSMLYKRDHNKSTMMQMGDYLKELGFPKL